MLFLVLTLSAVSPLLKESFLRGNLFVRALLFFLHMGKEIREADGERFSDRERIEDTLVAGKEDRKFPPTIPIEFWTSILLKLLTTAPAHTLLSRR